MTPVTLVTDMPVAPERVWRALVDPREIREWQADEASGSVEPGGRLELAWPELGVTLDLDVLEIEAQARLVLGRPGQRVAFELREGQLCLECSGESEEEREGVASAWSITLSLLKHYLLTRPPSRRRVYWCFEPCRTSAGLAHAYFTDPTALSSWLAEHATPLGESGTPYELVLKNGRAMSGTVLSNTPGRDVALSWTEDENSVLVLRTLPSPRHSQQRVLALVWSRWSEGAPFEPEETRTFLETALNSLAKSLDRPARA